MSSEGRSFPRKAGHSQRQIERWHKSLEGECIRPRTPLSLEDARRLVKGYVEHYNNVRFEQCHRLHHAKGHARRASAGDSGRAGSQVGSGEGTAEELPPAGRVTDETDYFRLADNSRVVARNPFRGRIRDVAWNANWMSDLACSRQWTD